MVDVPIPAGMRALWVALSGTPDMKYQAELLLPSYVTLSVTEVDTTGSVPEVRVAVSES